MESHSNDLVGSNRPSLKSPAVYIFSFLFVPTPPSQSSAFLPVFEPGVIGASGALKKLSQGCNWIPFGRFLLSGLTKHAVLLYISQANTTLCPDIPACFVLGVFQAHMLV